MKQHIFYPCGRGIHAIPWSKGSGLSPFTPDPDQTNVFMCVKDSVTRFTITVPNEDLPHYHIGSAYTLVKMPYAEDMVGMSPEEV